MSTSERLDKISEMLRLAQAEMRRLMVDLPGGATLEILESAEARSTHSIAVLTVEATKLRRWHD